MIITIEGKPIAKKRPKFFTRKGFSGAYNDQETEEGRWILDAKPQIMHRYTGPIKLRAFFYMPIGKSVSKKMRAAMIAREVRHTKKPDLDNLIKFVKDCLNGLAWADDSQVCEIVAFKAYGEQPRTVLMVEEL